MADYLLASDKVDSMKREAEQKYKKYEEQLLKYAKRNLMKYTEVMAECTGYLKALADLDLLDDFGESLNRMLLEHLKEIEIAQGCIANGINTLFSVMSERNEQLKLSRGEAEMIEHGQIALACLTERMADISGMNERGKRYEAEVHVVGKEDVEDFLDFLKEILS